jgi:tRNA(Leu) C34 or U34 (ribose-2'-O)-methylase TrmL
MISRSKFIKLKKITKYFRLADELRSVRDLILSGKQAEKESLRSYADYLKGSGETDFISELDDVLAETDFSRLTEKTHFLYHRIKESFGYADPEKRLIISDSDSETPKMPKTDIVVILENIRSAFNAGSVIRTCECFGVKELYLAGITPGADNPKTRKTSKSSENNLKIIRTDSIKDTISELKRSGYRIAGAETAVNSTDISDYKPAGKSAIVFGNEELGITADTLKLCDDIVSIRMRGIKNSLNVANAAAVFVYEFTRKAECHS